MESSWIDPVVFERDFWNTIGKLFLTVLSYPYFLCIGMHLLIDVFSSFFNSPEELKRMTFKQRLLIGFVDPLSGQVVSKQYRRAVFLSKVKAVLVVLIVVLSLDRIHKFKKFSEKLNQYQRENEQKPLLERYKTPMPEYPDFGWRSLWKGE